VCVCVCVCVCVYCETIRQPRSILLSLLYGEDSHWIIEGG